MGHSGGTYLRIQVAARHPDPLNPETAIQRHRKNFCQLPTDHHRDLCPGSHPDYLGLVLLILGIPIGSGSLLGLAIAILGGIPAIGYRITIEKGF